jgi:hypothetical protein
MKNPHVHLHMLHAHKVLRDNSTYHLGRLKNTKFGAKNKDFKDMFYLFYIDHKNTDFLWNCTNTHRLSICICRFFC